MAGVPGAGRGGRGALRPAAAAVCALALWLHAQRRCGGWGVRGLGARSSRSAPADQAGAPWPAHAPRPHGLAAASVPSYYLLDPSFLLLVCALIPLACCGCCCLCCVCNFVLARRWALRAVRRKRTRLPCPWSTRCARCADEKHRRRFSHPCDADYGFAVRVHNGVPEFSTLRQCFTFMDPEQRGFVNEIGALHELLRARDEASTGGESSFVRRALGGVQHWSLRDWLQLLWFFSLKGKLVHDIWTDIDTDGNGYISFPEFVEWATGPRGQAFGFPLRVGVVGQKGRSGEYDIPCTVKGCRCSHFVFQGDSEFCTCKHHFGYHSASPKDQILAVIPKTWEAYNSARSVEEHQLLLAVGQQGQSHRVECGEDVVQRIQCLMDDSSRQKWTRDRGWTGEGRRKEVPQGYEVVRVDRNENVRAWLKYILKKALMVEAHDDVEPFEPRVMRTSRLAGTLGGSDPPDEAVNEWYLWHGASAKGALSIADSEFKQSLAGTVTSKLPLYGRGTYMSDSCTKADEYAQAEDGGVYCLMLCRVMGGQVRYTDEVEPDAAALERDVLEGPYDCVLGDREKCRGTFKEIVIYESSQAYPEYLVYYKRRYDQLSTA